MLEVQEVSKNFTAVQAVDKISFTARAGEIFGLIGPNGAGKSTTIRMIMNILSPDSGKILFDGKMIREEDKDRIGYLPEERGMYKKVKVNDMLLYFGSLKSRDQNKIQKNIDLWLDRFELSGWKNHKVQELSKGMSQKIQFIASVAHEPNFIFFDEPFAGLDPVSSDLLRDAIINLGKEGKTILFSTHIMEQAERICSRILLLNKGKEVLSGSLEEIKNTYGKKTIIVEFDGPGDFIKTLPLVKNCITYPRYVELELFEGASSDELLRTLLQRISVRKFEIVSPSLHKIFVDTVGQKKEQRDE